MALEEKNQMEETKNQEEESSLSKKELKNERAIAVLPISQRFISNMLIFMETEEDWDLKDNWKIRGKKVVLTFELSEEAIDKQMIILEKKRKKLLQLRKREKYERQKQKKQDGTLNHIPLEEEAHLLEEGDITLDDEEEF